MMKNRKSASPVLPVTVATDGSGDSAGASPISGSHNNTIATSKRSKRSLLSSPPTTLGGEMLGLVKFLTALAACGFGAVLVLRSATTVATSRHLPQLSSSGEDDNIDPDSEFVRKKTVGVSSDQQQQLLLPEEAESRSLQNGGGGPFDEFATLSAQLAAHDLVALYFAASWCPMSTPVTNLLDDLFRETLLHGNQNKNAADNNNKASDFAILYVSSDKDEASFRNYLRPGWEAVPFADDHLDRERARLKKHFRTCAKREMGELELAQRDGQLPTVIVLDGVAARREAGSNRRNNEQQQRVVLTRHGIRDVKDLGAAALDHWRELQRLARALDGKYNYAATADMR